MKHLLISILIITLVCSLNAEEFAKSKTLESSSKAIENARKEVFNTNLLNIFLMSASSTFCLTIMMTPFSILIGYVGNTIRKHSSAPIESEFLMIVLYTLFFAVNVNKITNAFMFKPTTDFVSRDEVYKKTYLDEYIRRMKEKIQFTAFLGIVPIAFIVFSFHTYLNYIDSQ